MNLFQKHIALFLLLLFVRVMVPDGLVLALHSHAHTTHAAHDTTIKQHPDLAKIDTKHAHCPIEDLFGAPYQASHTSTDFSLLVHPKTYTVSQTEDWKILSFSTINLRGPPIA